MKTTGNSSKVATIETVNGRRIDKLTLRSSSIQYMSGIKVGRRYFTSSCYFVRLQDGRSIHCGTLTIARDEAAK